MSYHLGQVPSINVPAPGTPIDTDALVAANKAQQARVDIYMTLIEMPYRHPVLAAAALYGAWWLIFKRKKK